MVFNVMKVVELIATLVWTVQENCQRCNVEPIV